jgi:hypothetical protein
MNISFTGWYMESIMFKILQLFMIPAEQILKD